MKEKEALAAGVGKHGIGSWRTMHNYSKFARYLAQKSTTGLWKKSRTITFFRVSDEKPKPLSPKIKKNVAANLELEGINDRRRSSFDDHDQEEKTERVVEVEEDKEKSTLPTKVKNHPHLQNSANVEEVGNETERVLKLRELEDIKSKLLLLHEICGRFSKQDTNGVSAPAPPEAVNERMSLETEEDTDRFSATLPPQEENMETETNLEMEDVEDIKSKLMLLHEIRERFLGQDTNRVSSPAPPQSVKKSRKTSEIAEDIDRFSTTLPPQAENKETERKLEMEDVEDIKGRLMLLHEICGRFSGQDTNRVSAPAPPKAVESTKTSEIAEDIDRFSTTLPPQAENEETERTLEMENVEDIKGRLMLLHEIYGRFWTEDTNGFRN